MNTCLTRHLNSLALLTSIALSVHAENQEGLPIGTISLLEQKLDIKVELASSKEQREIGLMNRTGLDANSGMLFAYPDQAPRRVWMKNTLFPLDVLFLADDGRVVSMLDNLPPCQSDPCPIYNSQVAAMYMLELNAGFIKSKNLKIDQRTRLPHIKENTQTTPAVIRKPTPDH